MYCTIVDCYPFKGIERQPHEHHLESSFTTNSNAIMNLNMYQVQHIVLFETAISGFSLHLKTFPLHFFKTLSCPQELPDHM